MCIRDSPYLESIINTILGSYLTHRTANDPFIILTTIYGDLTLLEEQLMEVMLDNPKKLKKFQDKLEEKVISMVKCEVKKYGYKEMYTSFEEAANALVVYIPLEEYTFDDDEKFLEIEKAIQISRDVYKDIQNRKEIDIKTLKLFINYHLYKSGYNGKTVSNQITIGLSGYDLDNFIKNKSCENSNIHANNPETVSFTIAETTLKQYALKKVFSKEVAMAHLEGRIHLHDLGSITRVYCSAHSLRSIAKFGLGEYLNFPSSSKPAKYAETLIGHLNTFLCTMASYYAGALGIDFMNIYIAPYLKGKSYKEIKQIAQYLIFSLSQTSYARGGQAIFTDLNFFINIPKHLQNIPVIGPGGKTLETTYKDYERESRMFLNAVLEIALEGDSNGMPFAFPKINLHICKKSLQDPLFNFACHVASKNGSIYFIFDRDETSLSACCRLRAVIDENYIKEPERLRYCGFQNVTLNLAQCAYRSDIFKEIDRTLDIIIKAHKQKRKFIEQISKPGCPMHEVIGKPYFDGEPYINLDRATYLVGLIGLNECVQALTGKQLHESPEVFKLGLRIISYLNLKIKQLQKETGFKLFLLEAPAESASRRLALLDYKNYPKARNIIKGTKENPYYTNSIHFPVDAPISLIERIQLQSKFHPLIESGAIIHAFVGEHIPHRDSIKNLLIKTYNNTNCSQLVISPEFSVCKSCKKTFLGLTDTCSICYNKTEQYTRIVGYYSKINNWNGSKKQELHDRHLGNWSF